MPAHGPALEDAEFEAAEGRALLQALQDRIAASAPRCEHDWRDPDVLVWDNASVQHKAGGNFEVGDSRRFWRCMIAGPRAMPAGEERR